MLPPHNFLLTVSILSARALTHALHLKEYHIPASKLRGESAILRCDYEPKTSNIYSIKWFKDDEEFYRYVPRDAPPYHYFNRIGVSIDRTVSKPTRVVLRGISFHSSGQYRCEVSAEGPDFNTVTGKGSLLVVQPPQEGPEISGGQRKYHINDTVNLTCTSGPSRPLSKLSWQINSKPAPKELVIREGPHMDKDGLYTQISRLVFVARPWHFQRGKLRVKCLAEISQQALSYHNTVSPSFRPLEGLFQASAAAPITHPRLTLVILLVSLALLSRR